MPHRPSRRQAVARASPWLQRRGNQGWSCSACGQRPGARRHSRPEHSPPGRSRSAKQPSQDHGAAAEYRSALGRDGCRPMQRLDASRSDCRPAEQVVELSITRGDASNNSRTASGQQASSGSWANETLKHGCSGGCRPGQRRFHQTIERVPRQSDESRLIRCPWQRYVRQAIDHKPVGELTGAPSLWAKADGGGADHAAGQHPTKNSMAVVRRPHQRKRPTHQRHHSANTERARGLSRRVGQRPTR